MTNDLRLLTRDLSQIAREAGAFIAREARSFSRDAIEYKDFNNLVSYVDKEAEKLLVERLHRLLPEAGFITEEGTTGLEADQTGLNWIIDPLDGTANFIHKVPVYSVSVGLAEGNTPLAGVVFDINRDESFTAWQGGGAWCSTNGGNDEKIQVSPAQSLQESMIATGFP